MEGNETVLSRSTVGKRIKVVFPDAKRKKVNDPLGKRRLYYEGLVKRAG